MPSFCYCFENLKWTNIPSLEDALLEDDTEYSGISTDTDIYYDSGVMDACKITKRQISRFVDDKFRGSYNGTEFNIIEFLEYEIQGMDKQNIFKGVIVKIEMNKTFTGHTIIKPKNVRISPYYENFNTTLEKIKFSKKYDGYTNNKEEARTLITPAIMEQLKNMQSLFFAKSVRCAFFKDYTIIALPTRKNLFSVCSLIKPLTDKKQYTQMYNQMESIIKLIEILNNEYAYL